MKTYQFKNCKTGEKFSLVAKSWANAEEKANEFLGGILGKMEKSILKHRFYHIHSAKIV